MPSLQTLFIFAAAAGSGIYLLRDLLPGRALRTSGRACGGCGPSDCPAGRPASRVKVRSS